MNLLGRLVRGEPVLTERGLHRVRLLLLAALVVVGVVATVIGETPNDWLTR